MTNSFVELIWLHSISKRGFDICDDLYPYIFIRSRSFWRHNSRPKQSHRRTSPLKGVYSWCFATRSQWKCHWHHESPPDPEKNKSFSLSRKSTPYFNEYNLIEAPFVDNLKSWNWILKAPSSWCQSLLANCKKLVAWWFVPKHPPQSWSLVQALLAPHFPWARLAKGIIAIIGKVAQSFSKLCCCFGLIYFFLGPKVTNIKQALWWLKCTTIPKQWQATSVFKLKLPIIANHPNKETSPPVQCSMFNVQMERGSNTPTRGQMHHREVTHVRHHQRSMGQHVVTPKKKQQQRFLKAKIIIRILPTNLRQSKLRKLFSNLHERVSRGFYKSRTRRIM